MKYCCVKNIEEKYCEELLWRSIVNYCCVRSIGRSIVKNCFSEAFYFKKSKSGMALPRMWLCYSSSTDSAYCEPCWLFANRQSSSFNAAWVNGVRDWRHLTPKIQKHECTETHLDACLLMQRWCLNKTLDEQNENEKQNQIKFWRDVLERTINVPLTLASCNLPFRGHRESVDKPGSGSFLSVISKI